MTPASKLQEHLKKRVQGSGGQYRKVRWEGRRGCPDCFIWWTWPHAAFVEIKADRDVLSAIQRREVERMREDGVPVYIATSVADIEEIIEKVRKGVAS
jgi:hypothetical protein